MRKVWIYLAFTFGISWTLLIGAGIATGAYTMAFDGIDAFGTSAVLTTCAGAAMFCPLISVLLTRLVLRKKETLQILWRPRIKGNARWYLLAWLGTIALALLGTTLFFLLRPATFDPSMQAYANSLLAKLVATGMPAEQVAEMAGQLQARLTPAAVAATLSLAIFLAPFINMIPGFGEEIGWRGFLFPALAQQTSPRKAVILIGLIWGIWHAPMTLVGHNYGVGYWSYPVTGILVMCVACLSLSSILSYLTLKTSSAWPAALAHGAINAIANIGLVFFAGKTLLLGPSPLGLLGCIPLLVVAAVCWLKMPEQLDLKVPAGQPSQEQAQKQV